jgi:ADP-heptose:LPS heptosyltransferase
VIAVPQPRLTEEIVQGMVVDPGQQGQFLAAMRAEQFDLALQMHGAGEYSNPFVRGLGARISAGAKSMRAEQLDRWIPYQYYQNETLRMLEVASLVGTCTATVNLQPRMLVLPKDIQEAAPVLERIRGPFVVVHPGSTDPRRCWSPEKFAEVADFCADQGLEVVLTGKPKEAVRVRAIAAGMRAPVINLYDQLSLSGLTGLLSQATLFIGNDSGPLHLALAVGARAVGVFWAEYIINSMPLLRGNFYPVISWQRSCPACGKVLDKQEADSPQGPCTHEVSFVDEIQPAEVIRGVQTLLASDPG